MLRRQPRSQLTETLFPSTTRCRSDLDIVRVSRLGDFIGQDVLPLLTPGERTALVHASMLDTADTDILSGIAGQRDDGRIIAELAFRLRGLVDRHDGQFLLQRALRIWLRDAVEAFDGRRDRKSTRLNSSH